MRCRRRNARAGNRRGPWLDTGSRPSRLPNGPGPECRASRASAGDQCPHREGTVVHAAGDAVDILGIAFAEPVALADASIVQRIGEPRVVPDAGELAELREQLVLLGYELVVVDDGDAGPEPFAELERLRRLADVGCTSLREPRGPEPRAAERRPLAPLREHLCSARLEQPVQGAALPVVQHRVHDGARLAQHPDQAETAVLEVLAEPIVEVSGLKAVPALGCTRRVPSEEHRTVELVVVPERVIDDAVGALE